MDLFRGNEKIIDALKERIDTLETALADKCEKFRRDKAGFRSAQESCSRHSRTFRSYSGYE